jgi:hypothetical protein
MSGTLQVSFDGAADSTSPFVLIHNPSLMPVALLSQVRRYGLQGGDKGSVLSGSLKGTIKALTELIHTYGLTLSFVPFPEAMGSTPTRKGWMP